MPESCQPPRGCSGAGLERSDQQLIKSLLAPGRCGDTLLLLSLLLLCPFPTNCPCSSLQSLGESQGSTPLPGVQRA